MRTMRPGDVACLATVMRMSLPLIDSGCSVAHRTVAMTYRAAIACIATTLALTAAGDVRAQLYKWVDEKGVVNYGDKPPAGKNAQPVGEKSGSVTVVPGMSRDDLDRQRERETQQRLQQLEREVTDLRAREGSRVQTPPEPIYNDVYVPAYGYSYPSHRPPGTRPPRGRHYEPPPEPNPPLQFERPPERPARAARSVR